MRDRFDFVGLKRSRYRNIIRPLFAAHLRKLQPVEITAVVKDLWAQLEREFQYVAIDLLIRISNYLQAADLRLIDQLLRNKAWWDPLIRSADRSPRVYCCVIPSYGLKLTNGQSSLR